jgi:hypothetical protein
MDQPIALNHLAVITATVLAFVLGGIWYGPIFGKLWMRENGFTPESLAKANQGKIYGLAFLWTLVMAYNLAFFLGQPTIDVKAGLMYGFFTGFGWIAAGLFIVGLFERRSATLMAINGGYMALALTMMGGVIAAWR